MVRQWQQLIHGNRLSHSYTEALPDFVALARAFGWSARRVERREELDAALAECLDSAGPFFLDVVVQAEENCFPMMPAGAAQHEIWLGGRATLRLPARVSDLGGGRVDQKQKAPEGAFLLAASVA